MNKMELEQISDVAKKLLKLKQKLGLISQEEINKERFAALSIPDSDLTPQQVKQKRMLQMQRHAQEQRVIQKEKKKREKDEQEKLKEQNPKIYLSN